LCKCLLDYLVPLVYKYINKNTNVMENETGEYFNNVTVGIIKFKFFCTQDYVNIILNAS